MFSTSEMVKWLNNQRIGWQLSELFNTYETVARELLEGNFGYGTDATRLELMSSLAQLFKIYNSDKSNYGVLQSCVYFLEERPEASQKFFLKDFMVIQHVLGKVVSN